VPWGAFGKKIKKSVAKDEIAAPDESAPPDIRDMSRREYI
jgi:hypothetical protein